MRAGAVKLAAGCGVFPKVSGQLNFCLSAHPRRRPRVDLLSVFSHKKWVLGAARQKTYQPRLLDNLDPDRATKGSAAVVRLRSVVIDENTAEAAITKDGAAEFSNLGRCLQPA